MLNTTYGLPRAGASAAPARLVTGRVMAAPVARQAHAGIAAMTADFRARNPQQTSRSPG